MADLVSGFEQAVDALAHDAKYADVEFVAHKATRQARTHALQVIVDRADGVDLQTCERIASAINARLEGFEEPYTLEVESAGLNRPLTKAGDYDRFSGKAAKIVTTLTIDGSKTHRGTLRGVVGTNVILQTEKGELPLPLATIKSANLEYDIRADLQRAKRERKKDRHAQLQ
ncbi:MAG: hypothetical protein JO233_09720 [Candidatus Eremiobacteraeota bacterium]|nr:hypothetical protein [Candidatus Eremiobacteraeota bacterium]